MQQAARAKAAAAEQLLRIAEVQHYRVRAGAPQDELATRALPSPRPRQRWSACSAVRVRKRLNATEGTTVLFATDATAAEKQ